MKKIRFLFLFTSQFLFSQLNINHNVILNICDNNLDGIEIIDLNTSIPLISTDQTYIYQYFNSNSNAQNNINPIPNINVVTSNKIIYVRISAPSNKVDYAQIQINLLDCTMSTSENNKRKSSVFPNPTTDFINIKSEEKSILKEIFSVEGKKIKESYLNKISISELKSGIYFLKINKSKDSETIKFIKK